MLNDRELMTICLVNSHPYPHPHPHPWCYPYPRFSNAAHAVPSLPSLGRLRIRLTRHVPDFSLLLESAMSLTRLFYAINKVKH